MRKIILLLIIIVFFYSELSLLACEQEKKQVRENRLPMNIYNLIRTWKDIEREPMTVEDLANMRELKKFLSNKGNLEARDENGNSLLILASQFSNRDNLVDYLLNLGANINSVNRMGETALWNAVYYRNPETVEMLLDYGANIDRKTLDYVTTKMFSTQEDKYAFDKWHYIFNLLQYYPEYLKKRKQGELQNIAFDDYVVAQKALEALKEYQYLPDVLNQEIIEYITGPRTCK